MPSALHIDLDGAWNGSVSLPERLDATAWGPVLRFSAPARLVERFYLEIESQLPPFILYGSGDFHHLTALWIRRIEQPFVLVSFDNHPDWAVTPPRWSCGSWVNRALELPFVQRVSVWGCGGFECWWPHNLLGNRRAEREGRLQVHPWVDGRAREDQNRRGAILRSSWQQHFQKFVDEIESAPVYVTIDLDCLTSEEATTNWESGRFTAGDLVWALRALREKCRVVAGDVCGAFSPPLYARWTQRLAATIDHPKMSTPFPEQARKTNAAVLEKLWPWLAQ